MSYISLLFAFLFATTLHELGHVIGARIAGIEVSTFSIGFGPVLFRTSRRGVTYQICMIPLGGYVIPSGSMINRTRRIVFLAAGLLTSIILVPVGCLSLLRVTDPGSSFVSGLDGLVAPWLENPLRFLYDSLSLLLVDGPSTSASVIESLAAASLFLGLANCLPLLMLDGGQILFLLLEGWFPSIRKNEQVLFLISYCILALLIAGPLLFALVQEIRTTYPILLIGFFVLYRVIRLTPGFSFRVKK